jgi:peptidoglycan/LPS O-acetylase OafA/YrhL
MIVGAGHAGSLAPSSGAGRMVALDGLRGVAVLLVLVEHFTYNEWVRSWSPGAVGVKTFFVLSGFLITGVLLDARARFTVRDATRHFFSRRMLRLVPAFMIAILLGLLLGIGGLRADWPWHVAYLSNVHVWLQENWSSAGHFWTLALEQQFYLVWFPVVVMLRRRWLLPVVLGLLVAAPLFRSAVMHGASPFIDVLLPAQSDALAAGALLTLVLRGEVSLRVVTEITRPATLWSALAGLFVLLSLPALGVPRPDFVSWVLIPSMIVLCAFGMIATAVTDPDRLAVLATPVLVKLGTISYGLYIYHYFVPQFFTAYLPHLAEAEGLTEKLVRLAAWVTLSIALAATSWHFVEKPLLRSRTTTRREPRVAPG